MTSKPRFELIHLPRVGFNREHHLNDFANRSVDLVTVSKKEFVNNGRRGSFIAADPGMVFDEPKTEGGCLPKDVDILVICRLLRARQRRFDQGSVGNTVARLSAQLH